MDVVVLLVLFLEINQLSEQSLLNVLVIHSFVIAKHVIVLNDVDVLVLCNKGLAIVLSQFIHFFHGFTNEEECMFSVKFFLLVDQCEQEHIVRLRAEVHLQLDLLVYVLVLNSNGQILLSKALLPFYYCEKDSILLGQLMIMTFLFNQ